MTVVSHSAEALRLLNGENESFCAEVAALAASDWDRPTNCPPWSVRQLVAHLVRGAENYLLTLQRALAGEPGEPESRESRTARMNHIAAQEPPAIVADTRAIIDRFQRKFGALSAQQLDALGAHSHGPRPASWFIDQRLAEVAFHHWDLQRSLDRPAGIDQATAAFLLPMLLEQNFPAIVARDGTGGHGRYGLTVRGEPALSWQIDFGVASAKVARGGAAVCPVTFEADAATLGLLIYGRESLSELERAGRLAIRGDPDAAARFESLFRGP
jgi:uncharacterized protein (TIGR03083 family)